MGENGKNLNIQIVMLGFDEYSVNNSTWFCINFYEHWQVSGNP